MKKILFCFILGISPILVRAQSIIISKSDNFYKMSEQKLKGKGKSCLIINLLSVDFVECGNQSVRPLLLFKVFDYSNSILLKNKPSNALSIGDYIKTIVVPKLCADMLINVTTMETLNSTQSTRILDSLVVFDGKKYELIRGGVILSEFFNVVSYPQYHPMQTNQSTFNLTAIPVKTIGWSKDSIPLIEIDQKIDAIGEGKIFRLSNKKGDYVFASFPFMCDDCPLTFYNEYLYRNEIGVIAFKSKYVFLRTDEFRDQKFGESSEYYYFR